MSDGHSNRNDIDEAMGRVRSGLGGALEGTVVLGRHLWNLEMRLISKAGLMGIFRSHWWLFLVVGFLLLAFVFPLGVIFTLSAFCAGAMDPKAADDFIVPLRKQAPYS